MRIQIFFNLLIIFDSIFTTQFNEVPPIWWSKSKIRPIYGYTHLKTSVEFLSNCESFSGIKGSLGENCEGLWNQTFDKLKYRCTLPKRSKRFVQTIAAFSVGVLYVMGIQSFFTNIFGDNEKLLEELNAFKNSVKKNEKTLKTMNELLEKMTLYNHEKEYISELFKLSEKYGKIFDQINNDNLIDYEDIFPEITYTVCNKTSNMFSNQCFYTLWKAIECNANEDSNRLNFDILIPEIIKDAKILEARPFTIYVNTSEGLWCPHKYSGKRLLLTLDHECFEFVNIPFGNDLHYFVHPFQRVFKCEKTNSIKLADWIEQSNECSLEKPNTFQFIRQASKIIIYCYGHTLRLENSPEQPCPQKVLEFDADQNISIDGLQIFKEQTLEVNIKEEFGVTINDTIEVLHFVNLSSNIEDLITQSYVIKKNRNFWNSSYIFLIITSLIVIFSLIVSLCYCCFCRKIHVRHTI